MSNIKSLHSLDHHGPALAWLARGLEAALRNNVTSEHVMVTIGRTDAIDMIRLIDERNGDADRTG